MSFQLNEAIEILEQTPHTLKSLLGNLSDTWTNANEGDHTWSAYDVIGHLIHGELTDWIPRLKVILLEENKTFVPFDRFAQFENSKGKTLAQLLDEFADLRAQNVAYLKSLALTEIQLTQTGIHPELGEATARQLLATWTAHDLGHILQISRVMAKRYKNEVGVWKQYLTVVNM